MTRRGFIFNHDLCVRCNACSAACILENGWDVMPRTIYQINSEAFISVPVINLSMACNHCQKPACLNGCPAGTLYKDEESGAILVNDKRCLGCNYCTWNCPYESPKPDKSKGIIAKCNLCNTLLNEGGNPACASACPTGALTFGVIPENHDNSRYGWFPEKILEPSLKLTGSHDQSLLQIIPENIFDTEITSADKGRKYIGDEWSLAVFSFLASISVALMCSMALTGKAPNKLLFLSITILAGLISFLHLGKKARAWRAVTNILKSPLSREIASYIIYLFLSSAAILSDSEELIVASAFAGLAFLMIIDTVYSFSDNRRKLLFHSGQTFLTGLLIGSFFSGMTVSFLFIGGIKLISGIYNFISDKDYPGITGFRFLRIFLLLATGVIQISGLSSYDPFILFLFLSGELIDRCLYYHDFEPESIETTISEYLKSFINEKKGD
jgi:Fe-S-cluster-containing dehydrogenase component